MTTVSIFARFDASGRAVGFWNTDVHGEDGIPLDALPVTEEEWRLLLSGHVRREDGAIVEPEPFVPSLEQVRAARLEELRAAHEEAIALGCLTSLGIRLDCDPKAISDFQGALALRQLAMDLGAASADDPVLVGTFDNDTVEVAWPQYQALCLELGAHYQALFHRKWELREAILAAATVEDVRSVELSF